MADSTADFPEGMIKKLNINLIPIHILVDGKDYLHGVDISNEEVIEYMKEEREVKTFPPLPSEYSDFYEKMANRYDHIISFHVSSDLSNNSRSHRPRRTLYCHDAPVIAKKHRSSVNCS